MDGRDEIARKLKEIGFKYVTLDLEGFRSGSMNEVLVMDVQEIRADFPILKDVIYLDSASTSLTPEPVLEAVLDYYR